MVPRPALIISHAPLGPNGLLVWALMITNAAREDWPGDIAIPDWEAIGLLAPSKVRTTKISTIETARASLIGRLPHATMNAVRDVVRQTLG